MDLSPLPQILKRGGAFPLLVPRVLARPSSTVTAEGERTYIYYMRLCGSLSKKVQRRRINPVHLSIGREKRKNSGNLQLTKS